MALIAQLAVFKNGIEVPNSRFVTTFVSNEIGQMTGQVTVPLAPGDNVDVRNVGLNAFNINPTNGGVSASLNIEKVD